MRFEKNKAGWLNRLRSEHGSALVLVMFVVLLLTILGLAVLSATIGGAQRTETRESDVQSLHLAQKGLNEAAAYIQSQFEGIKDINPDKVEDILASIGKQNLNVTTELRAVSSSATGEIQDIRYSGKTVTSSSRKYYIDVTTWANVNGVRRKLQQRITLDSYPDFLKYAFGSEQTLRLNGSPVLQGNIYAGDQLLVTNTAEYTYKGQQYSNLGSGNWFPTVRSNDAGTAPGEVHVQSADSIRYADTRMDARLDADFNVLTQADYSKVLHITPDKLKIKEKKKFVQINIVESFLDKLAQGLYTPPAGGESQAAAEAAQSNLRNMARSQYNAGTLTGWLQNYIGVEHISGMPQAPVKKQNPTEEEQKKYEEDLVVYQAELDKLKLLNKSMIFNGNLLVDGLSYQKLYYPVASSGNDSKSGSNPRWFIVAGDLEINNFTASFLPVRANILVTGNVKIKGNVQFDSTMFVLGQTTVEDANIKGIVENGAARELVLISKGSVLINRLMSFAQNVPTDLDTMEAFFYTDSTGELYGVGSMFRLKGGFFAKGNLTVNAVTGTVTEPATPGALSIVQQSQPERFVIDYNTDVYEHQQSSLPRVENVNVQVGPMQLVN
ncbi:hypothetical protein [Paenibacillus sp. NFR01]|uniref:hypothetical protein n=1 Tax=Paenibacillus sp. NFR01 TaxID=1566279 RepID=UPI0008BCC2F9|nr:hypothetical protein [Paenibacillus sp. NFR01]SEU14647.1 hypothetical protein SAMN03159358_3607 [Paenibacillus sp. NFR01]